VLVLRGQGHQIQDDLRLTPPSLWEVRARENSDSVSAVAASWAVLWGAFSVGDSTASRILRVLPPVIHVPQEHGRPSLWIDKLRPILVDEIIHSGLGSQAIVQGVMKLLVVLAVRRFVSTLPATERDKISAYLDPEIGPALAVIHARFDHPWTVGTLAQEAAMSRSSFASKFVARLGLPPLEYVTRVRMEHAKLMLTDRQQQLKQVARSVGYLSESAFSSAFRRVEGVSPAHYREHLSRLPAPPPIPSP
jgi:AraC-like DNA-binding protein